MYFDYNREMFGGTSTYNMFAVMIDRLNKAREELPLVTKVFEHC